jgi:hypothetical protein
MVDEIEDRTSSGIMSDTGVVEAKIQTAEDIYRLVWTAKRQNPNAVSLEGRGPLLRKFGP